MTTYTTISNAAVAVGGIPSSATVTALRDNPIAISEAATGAPVVFAGWHPYDKVTIGDGKDGVIYDFAVNGVQANVVTPDFEDGYEYRIVARDLSHNSGSQSVRLEIADSTGTYVSTFTAPGAGTISFVEHHFDAQIMLPRLVSRRHAVLFLGYGVTNPNQEVITSGLKLLRGRISFTAGSIDAGKIWMFRRREYASLP